MASLAKLNGHVSSPKKCFPPLPNLLIIVNIMDWAVSALFKVPQSTGYKAFHSPLPTTLLAGEDHYYLCFTNKKPVSTKGLNHLTREDEMKPGSESWKFNSKPFQRLVYIILAVMYIDNAIYVVGGVLKFAECFLMPGLILNYIYYFNSTTQTLQGNGQHLYWNTFV